MWYGLDVLTADEYEIVEAKLRSAEAQAEKLHNELEEFIDSLDEDMPFVQRIEILNSRSGNTAMYWEAEAIRKAIIKVGDRSEEMRQMRREFHELRVNL